MHSYKLHWHCIMNHAQWPPVKSTFLIISAVISVPEPETFYVSACRVANSSRSWYVQRCSQRQVSNPQTSVTVLRSKITSAATKSIDSTQNFPHENSESFVHRRPTVWRTETVFSPWEYAAVTYEQLYCIDCFMIEMGNQESHSIKMPYCVPFSILSNWSLERFALAVASLWSKFLQPWSK